MTTLRYLTRSWPKGPGEFPEDCGLERRAVFIFLQHEVEICHCKSFSCDEPVDVFVPVVEEGEDVMLLILVHDQHTVIDVARVKVDDEVVVDLGVELR